MRFLRVTFASFLLALPSIGYAQNFTGQQYKPLGFCQLTAANLASAVGFSASTSAACNGSIPSGATWVEICVSGAGISYRDDGVAPTASVGMLISSGTCFPYSVLPLTAFQAILQSSGATIGASFYK